jgi:hypothetical protein
LLEKFATLYDDYNKAGNRFQVVEDSDSDVSLNYIDFSFDEFFVSWLRKKCTVCKVSFFLHFKKAGKKLFFRSDETSWLLLLCLSTSLVL